MVVPSDSAPSNVREFLLLYISSHACLFIFMRNTGPKVSFSVLSVSGFDSCLLISVSVCRFQASLSLRSIFYTFFFCEQVRDAPPPASHTTQVITPLFTQVAEPGELSVNPSSKFPGQRIPLAQPAGRVCPPSNRLWPWVGSQSTDMAPRKGQLPDLI